MNAFQEAARTAKTPEEQQKVFQEKYPKKGTLAPKFVELAEKNPKDPIALDALIWVMNDNIGPRGTTKEVAAKAIALLTRDHLDNAKLGSVCQSLGNGMDTHNDQLLRAILEKNPHADVKAEACLALAQRISQRADLVKRFKNDAGMAKQLEEFLGKDEADAFRKIDAAKAEAESELYYKELADQHLPHIKQPRLMELCQMLSFSAGKGSDVFLRTVLDKDTRRDVQGVACLVLGQVLKQQADRQSSSDDKAAARLREESEKLLERAVEKYADVKLAYFGTVGAKAKGELNDLRLLSVGKVAPEVEGVDQDGRKFKLSDYRGKVVFLDFWSQY